jgi:hypothetical protein
MWNDHDHSNLIKEEDSGQWTTVGSSSQSASVGETITRNSWIVRTQERSQLNLVSVVTHRALLRWGLPSAELRFLRDTSSTKRTTGTTRDGSNLDGMVLG